MPLQAKEPDKCSATRTRRRRPSMPLAGHYPAPSPHLVPGPFTSWRSLTPSLSPSGSQENPSRSRARRPEQPLAAMVASAHGLHAETPPPPYLGSNRPRERLHLAPTDLASLLTAAPTLQSAAAAACRRRRPLLSVAGAPQATLAPTETIYRCGSSSSLFPPNFSLASRVGHHRKMPLKPLPCSV